MDRMDGKIIGLANRRKERKKERKKEGKKERKKQVHRKLTGAWLVR